LGVLEYRLMGICTGVAWAAKMRTRASGWPAMVKGCEGATLAMVRKISMVRSLFSSVPIPSNITVSSTASFIPSNLLYRESHINTSSIASSHISLTYSCLHSSSNPSLSCSILPRILLQPHNPVQYQTPICTLPIHAKIRNPHALEPYRLRPRLLPTGILILPLRPLPITPLSPDSAAVSPASAGHGARRLISSKPISSRASG